MIIEYPICKDYVKNWGIWEAVREFLQNAMDSENYKVSWTGGILHIWNPGVIERKTFLLGMSEKSDGSRGQFGEGMKLAMLVLARMKRQMWIRSNGEEWVPEISYSETFKEDIFKVNISSSKTIKSAEVAVKVTEQEWKEIQSKWLRDEKYGQLEGRRKGLIFVGGLYVCTLKGFEYAYNFSPKDIRLNRDRDIPSMFSVQDAAMKYASDTQLLDMAMAGKGDVNQFTYRNAGLAAAFRKNYGADVVPVGISEQHAIKAKKVKIVPDWVAQAIRSVAGYIFKRQGTPLDRLEKWYNEHNSYENWWDELKEIIKEMKGE